MRRSTGQPAAASASSGRWSSATAPWCRGRNVLRTAKLGTGQYAVFFTADVSRGVYVATIGRPGIATEPAGQIGVALRCCPDPASYLPFETNKGVWVDTHDSSGAYSDRAFHLVVLVN